MKNENLPEDHDKKFYVGKNVILISDDAESADDHFDIYGLSID